MKRGAGPDHVVLLPGLGGSVLTLVWVARTYPGSETVAGVELAGTAPASIGSVAALASSHLAALADVAGGRLHLVGHCLGATVAMEMAHQLCRAGAGPGAVILLEPFLRLGGELEDEERRCGRARQHAAGRLRLLLESTPGREVPALASEAAVVEDLGEVGLDPALLRFGVEFALQALAHAAAALPAYLEHRPRTVPAPVHLLLAEGSCGDAAPIERRLRQIAGGASVQRFACSPAEVLRQPHAAVVAERIAALVAGA